MPPTDPPVTPPTDPPVTPPTDPPPPPPVTQPPPLGNRAYRDEYDAANHRLLVADCANGALRALDLATGEYSVLIDTWPWTEPVDLLCVREIVVDGAGQRAFATVFRWFPEESDGTSCSSRDLVAIDLETREVTQMKNIDYNCCDSYCGDRSYSSLQVDEDRARLLYLEIDSVADYSTYLLSGIPTAPGPAALQLQLSPDCYPDDESCTGEPWPEFRSFAFDPAAAEPRALLLGRRYPIGDYSESQYFLDTLDAATGAVVASLPLQLIDLAPGGGVVIDLSVDTEKQRALLTWGSPAQWKVGAVDLVTGEETLLYDGSPTAGGAQLACNPEPAFDSRERRILLPEQNLLGAECTNVFAVDADTGEFTQLIPGGD